MSSLACSSENSDTNRLSILAIIEETTCSAFKSYIAKSSLARTSASIEPIFKVTTNHTLNGAISTGKTSAVLEERRQSDIFR